MLLKWQHTKLTCALTFFIFFFVIFGICIVLTGGFRGRLSAFVGPPLAKSFTDLRTTASPPNRAFKAIGAGYVVASVGGRRLEVEEVGVEGAEVEGDALEGAEDDAAGRKAVAAVDCEEEDADDDGSAVSTLDTDNKGLSAVVSFSSPM